MMMGCGALGMTSYNSQATRLQLGPATDRTQHGFGERFNVLDFGAKGNGSLLNTQAIQQAIDTASRNNGGIVVIPEGRFLSGHLTLKSNVELHLESNAVLLGSTDIEHYKKTARGWYALISAHRAENIAITGAGTIDGQGLELGLNIRERHLSGLRESPNFNTRRSRPHETERPQNIELMQCSNIHIYDVTIKNAASWVQTYEQCRHLTIDNIRVDSDAYWNNDGIDIADSTDVRVTNCFVNAADDGICLKSETPGLANDRVLISNCRVRSSASAVKFGTASKGGFKNITVENIEVFDTYRSAIALECVDGGDLENVSVSNINAVNTGNAIFIRLGHRNQNGKVGTLKNISIKNVRAQIPLSRPDIDYNLRGPALNQFFNPIPASIVGIPGHQIENVTLENIEISYPGRAHKAMGHIPANRLDHVPENAGEYPEYSMFGELPAWGLYVRHVNNINLKNLNLTLAEPDFRPAFVFDDVSNLALTHSRINTARSRGEQAQIWLQNTRGGFFSQNSILEGQLQQMKNVSQIIWEAI